MYNWPTMVLANVLVEMPWNIFAGTIFFVCWYWTVGFPSETNRAGYAYFLFMLFVSSLRGGSERWADKSVLGIVLCIICASHHGVQSQRHGCQYLVRHGIQFRDHCAFFRAYAAIGRV